MNEQGMRFRLGIFVLASIILLAFLIMLFARMPTVFKQVEQYTIVFSNAQGVAAGTPVRRSGVRIGQVQTVELDSNTGKVRVTILIEKPHVLFEDDQPTLVHGLLGGDVSIEFRSPTQPLEPAAPEPPRPDLPPPAVLPVTYRVAAQQPGAAAQPQERVPAKPGKEFQGVTQADVSGLFRRLDQMAPLFEETLRGFRDLAKITREELPNLRRTNDEIQAAVTNWGKLGERLNVLVQTNQDKAVQVLDNLNDSLARAVKLFSDENQRNLAATLKNVREGSESLGALARQTEELLKESRRVVQRVGKSVEQADQVMVNLQQATKPLADRGGTVMKNLEESTEKLNRTLGDVRDLVQSIARGDGTLQRFVADPTLYHNLNDAALMLTRVMPRVDRILRDVEVFADKIARHPESLGIGGAVSPSSGLKEAPSSGLRPPRGPGH